MNADLRTYLLSFLHLARLEKIPSRIQLRLSAPVVCTSRHAACLTAALDIPPLAPATARQPSPRPAESKMSLTGSQQRVHLCSHVVPEQNTWRPRCFHAVNACVSRSRSRQTYFLIFVTEAVCGESAESHDSRAKALELERASCIGRSRKLFGPGVSHAADVLVCTGGLCTRELDKTLLCMDTISQSCMRTRTQKESWTELDWSKPESGVNRMRGLHIQPKPQE